MPRNRSEKNTPLTACAAAYAKWLPEWERWKRSRDNFGAEQHSYRTYQEAEGALSKGERETWLFLNSDQRLELHATQ